MSLRKRRALVTGGTRGIGAAIAERLREDGLEVIVTGRTAPPGRSCEIVDFSDGSGTEAFAKALQEMNIDVLINNAGTNEIAPFEKINLATFDKIQEINLRVPFMLCQAVVPGMRSRGWGRIVNITSIFGKVSKSLRASYSASKFGLDGMTAALAAEVASHGILANCVAPGFVDTDLTRKVLGESGMLEIASTIPIGRLAKPMEIAELVGWLASERNTYVSGQNISIDGGFTRV